MNISNKQIQDAVIKRLRDYLNDDQDMQMDIVAELDADEELDRDAVAALVARIRNVKVAVGV